ncbi:STAS-like domain-containing protein [Niabella pedocola]|uniref:STAS-like domain-containing protein n=1 Tax=Niabella pedocola TaxID=1752077 RepID=A0ABS8PV41_9BACT|nr:STAS-like domain-containing protein [Niabella pedocola]MCD2424934.1 STAS-like domain-containing protein [Niabella pedocola]
MNIQFKNIGIHLGTRVHGAEIRSQIVEAMKQSDKIVFDFSDVETVSNSFADECFAKLTLFFSLDEVKSKTTFVNASPFIKAVIANSFKARLQQQALA